VAQVLIAGTYNTLGRAAIAAGQMPQATKNFRNSIAGSNPNTDLDLATKARARHQWQLMGTSVELPGLTGDASQHGRGLKLRSDFPPDITAPPQTVAREQLEALTAELRQQRADLAKQTRMGHDDLNKVRKHLENVTKKELFNVTKQLEAFLNVQSALSGGDLVPRLHGWPISSDLAAFLIELIRANDYDLVVEFGSGTSTVIMAKALAQRRHRREGKPPPVQVAFEHLEQYHEQTQTHLRAAGLADSVTVYLAPLSPYLAANGRYYNYYDCKSTLQPLSARCNRPTCRVLVLVDGPPEATGEHARYPALEAVLTALGNTAFDVVLDDYKRPGEKEVANMWETDLRILGRSFTSEILTFEKEAYSLIVI
jgi:hypothetical protein